MNNDRIVGNCPRCGAPYDSTMEFCAKCSANLITNIKFKRGRQIPSYEDKVNTMYNDAQYCLLALSKRAKTSGRIWTVTAIVHLVLTIITFPFPFWIAAVANTVWAVSRFKHSKQILLPNKELIAKYDSVWFGFSSVLSLLFGGLVSLIGIAYDDRTRNYVHSNAGLIGWYCTVR